MVSKSLDNVSIVILAAGLGTRMKSNQAKVLHTILGKPMISHVLKTACSVSEKGVVVVVGHQADKVKNVCSKVRPVSFALQKEQKGTGHAVLCALPAISDSTEHVIILCGDVPLLQVNTIQALLKDHMAQNRDVTLLAVEVENPRGYGRVVMNADRELTRIVEEADASDAEKSISLINSGIYCVSKEFLTEALNKITPDNAQGEFYLTDIIEVGYAWKKRLGVVVGEDPEEISGVNTIDDLNRVERIMSTR